jgi:ketosteroid isomerase-like protein
MLLNELLYGEERRSCFWRDTWPWMQPGSVEPVREIIDALNRGDVDAMLARMDPDFEWRPLEGSPVSRLYRGHEHVRRYVEDWRSTFDNVWLELGKPSAVGDHVVVGVRGHGRSRASGVELYSSFCQVWTCAAERRCGWTSFPLGTGLACVCQGRFGRPLPRRRGGRGE